MNAYSFYIQGANIFELKKYLILSFFLIGITCEAQIKNFLFHASANYPIIKTVETYHQPITVPIAGAAGYTSFVIPVGVRELYVSKVGFEIGGKFDYNITSKFFITSGLSINHIRYKRTVEISPLSPNIQSYNLPTTVGQPFGALFGSVASRDAQGIVEFSLPALLPKSENVGNTMTLALQMPALIGTSFLNKKLEVRTGALFSYLLYATQTKQQYAASTQSLSEYKDSSKDGFNEFQAGITVQTTYLFGHHRGIDFSVQKFFTPIYKSAEQFGGESKYNLLSLGLSYKL